MPRRKTCDKYLKLLHQENQVVQNEHVYFEQDGEQDFIDPEVSK